MKESIGKLDDLTKAFRDGTIQVPEGYRPEGRHEHADSATSIRRTVHCGKEIEVHTTYKILVDGEPIREHVVALEDGTVHYHGLPNYSFLSAVELARRIVDRSLIPMPEDELNPSGSEEGGHGEEKQ